MLFRIFVALHYSCTIVIVPTSGTSSLPTGVDGQPLLHSQHQARQSSATGRMETMVIIRELVRIATIMMDAVLILGVGPWQGRGGDGGDDVGSGKKNIQNMISLKIASVLPTL